MDSSDGERSKSSDVESSENNPKHGSRSFNFRDDDRPGRVLLRPWLENMLESSTIEGLQWIDKEKTMFKVPWKHRSKKDWSTRHSSVFLEWAKNTGRWNKGDPTPNYAQLKTRLRCAFNKAPDIEEMKGYHSSQGEEPYKVYRFRNKKECLAQKLKALNAKNMSKGFISGTPGVGNNNSNLWEIKKEKCEEEMVVLGTEMYLSDGVQETQILSFKDGDGEAKDQFHDEIGTPNLNGLDQVMEQKFIPSVIPLTVEMFSSSMSDESDMENEGSKRPKSHRGRNNARGQKHLDVSTEPQNPTQASSKQHLNDFDLGTEPACSISSDITTNVSNEVVDCKGKSDLDFFRVASLFVEAGKILQNNKESPSKEAIEGEARHCIKQEIPDNTNLEDITQQSHEEINNNDCNNSGKVRQSMKIVQSLNSVLATNASIKTSTTSNVTNLAYSPRLPKLVPLSTLKNFHMLNPDSRGISSGSILSQLPKIRMVNANILHQISKSPVRFSPSPGTSALPPIGSAIGISRPEAGNIAAHFQPRLVIFSSNSFLPVFSAPNVAISRSTNPENVRIVLNKPQSSINSLTTKDSGISSQSLPSLIMLSSAAEVAESNGPSPAISQETSFIEMTSQSRNTTLSNTNTTLSNTDTTSMISLETAVSPSTVAPFPGMVSDIPALDSDTLKSLNPSPPIETQEEALDLSNSASILVHKENHTAITREFCDKLEIDESAYIPKENLRCATTTDDVSIDITRKLNEAGTILREMEETFSGEPKLFKSLTTILEHLKVCSLELNQWHKSLISQKDIIHWRTKLLESEEEKIELKAKCLGVSLRGEVQTDSKHTEISHSAIKNSCNTNLEMLSETSSFSDRTKCDLRELSSILAPFNSFIPNDKALDLARSQSSLLINKSISSITSVPSHKTILSVVSTSGSVKMTVSPTTTALPQTLNTPAKSPKPIRVINLGKPPEPCGMGVVYPMQQDRNKVQLPRPSTPAFSVPNGAKLGSLPRNSIPHLDFIGVSPSQSSTSPLILNIQNPFNHVKVVKINRTPSTEGGASNMQMNNNVSWCPTNVLSPASSHDPGIMSCDKELKSGDSIRDAPALQSKNGSKQKYDDESLNGISSVAKKFKSLDSTKEPRSVGASNDGQTTRGVNQFVTKWYSGHNQSLTDC